MLNVCQRWAGLGLVSMLFVCLPALAELRLPGLFSDQMVVQRGQRIPVWGWAEPGARVEVSLSNRSVTTRADDAGRWSVRLRRLDAGGPHTLTVSDETLSIAFRDVLVGDVWLCSGQSNMWWPVEECADADAEIAAANYPLLRLFTVPQETSTTVREDVGGAWAVCSPETVASFSAVAYYFGRQLHLDRDVPIGLLHSSWGGTPVEAWTSRERLERNAARVPMVEQWDEMVRGYDSKLAAYKTAYAEWEAAAAIAEEKGEEAPGRPREPIGPGYYQRPSNLYNSMIAPVAPFGIKGAIWYQGESNVPRAYQYRDLFPTMIEEWRDLWGQGRFPFLFVQLANYGARPAEPADSSWAELREAQTMTLSEANTGMAVIIDIGEAEDIHPKNKQDVGRRLAASAYEVAYGERGQVYSGPVYRSARERGGEMYVRFRHADGGLKTGDGGAPAGFSIAGEDGEFVWADARIDGDKVIVSSERISRPVAVRYGWADDPLCNLYNGAGLPASPFRTDDWREVTRDKVLVF